jgi:hypothetical protein
VRARNDAITVSIAIPRVTEMIPALLPTGMARAPRMIPKASNPVTKMRPKMCQKEPDVSRQLLRRAGSHPSCSTAAAWATIDNRTERMIPGTARA